MSELFAEVAVFTALDKTLHYRVPSHLRARVLSGMRVLVPLGRRDSLGLIVKLHPLPHGLPETVTVRPLKAVLDDVPVIPEQLLELFIWVSKYYLYPLGEVLQLAVPAKARILPRLFFRLSARDERAESRHDGSPLMNLLFQETEISAKELERKLGCDKEVQHELQKLEDGGVVERIYRFDSLGHQLRRGKGTRLHLVARPGPEHKISRNMADVIALFESSGGSATRHALREQVSNADYYIRKLTKMGCIELKAAEDTPLTECFQLPRTAEAHDLTSDQQNIVDVIGPRILEPSFQPFLLFGVTGSGKSEIYLRLAEIAVNNGSGVLILVPEIALTLQLETLFRNRFGSKLAVWHSGLSTRDRDAQWYDILSGRRNVVVGARSAVFMPVGKLGLIVVDEEHDSSFKQDDHLRYHARDVALMRAQMQRIPIVLGSATPSLQSLQHTRTMRYRQLELPRRIQDRPLPNLEVIDMRRENRRHRILSSALQQALARTFEAGLQSLLFLNRRGFASFVLCNACGHVVQCDNCSVSLTYHDRQESMCCHYCGAEKKLPPRCPICDQAALILHGFGTERVEKEVKKLLPEAKVLRIDRDTASEPRCLAECLKAIREHRANVIIGTQMLTKGHDFPKITLVGVVNADTSLQVADYRAGETTVQLLMQVAGRAGRGDEPGQVILQTYNPSHYTMLSVLQMDYLGFCGKELESRERLQYPPFVKLMRLLVTSAREDLTREASHQLADVCRTVASGFRSRNRHLAILGPSPAPVVKLQNRFRWHLYIKAWTSQDLQEFAETVLDQSRNHPVLRRVQLAVDRDPTVGT